MKKKTALVILLILVPSTLFGCQSAEQIVGKTHLQQQVEVVSDAKHVADMVNQQSVVGEEKLKLQGEIKEVVISESNGNVIAVFSDFSTLTSLTTLLSNSVKNDGIANMASPDFHIDVSYVSGGKEVIYLWLGGVGEGSTLMKTEESHIIYSISDIDTVALKGFIQ